MNRKQLKEYGMSNPTPVYKTLEEETPFVHTLVTLLMADGSEVKSSCIGVCEFSGVTKVPLKWKYRYESWI